MRGKSSLLIPIPLSPTLRTISSSRRRAVSLISPSSPAYFTALSIKLWRASCSRTRSARIIGKSGGTSTMTLSCLLASFFSQSRINSSKKLDRSTSSSCKLGLADSNCASVSRSSASESRRFECRSITPRIRKFLARHFRAVEQGFNIAAQDRQWRSQFVRNVGDKIPPHLIDLLDLGYVVKQNQCSGNLARLVSCRDGVELDLQPIQGQLGANWPAAI